ncbi:MAG: bifunctional 2-C-methyl-D-erythritol 4-phosphate cytidylyltransferase/2-C-methyl-D-erythritol [Devosia sp.]|uniref:bifunctional 2-C-methyl-D-erythritol 4-phosphate cytidylyltransferase/2-C-methyl-D-erythritol 2,4-cyclodiphosphate synthase n=1 Tax=Devosia sp. TaxID=1871048 RepID=UPI002635A8C2|nr:bifunctional 2-C-methyl-D-erythritol 4-phosphate cytidylyltransferase/2-C-methyl-D-erythritol 2,4-cyclodiphosphate synthase [Devosia sp.]MDB5531675.1 bifunctional 2-C-methyl-D-erythritol 4-phosphate cytidylyltransferase/2-C-methyl-D-erythritol [Devosia sp.]
MDFSAIIVAAGSGQRAGQGPAKQWRRLAGRPVLRWSAQAMLEAGAAPLVVVVQEADRQQAQAALAGLEGWVLAPGGATRTASVRAGLVALGSGTAPVLIHDAARPFLTKNHIDALLAALADAEGAVPLLPVADTLKRQGDALTTVSRDGLGRAQTPQAFRRPALLAAYAALPGDDAATDDAAVVEANGGRVVATPGDPMLMKLTYPEDFTMAEALAASLAASGRTTRTGQGFDAHRWGPGEAVWLCGVRIDHGQSLIGHSDADAGLHALTDALLGAIGEGDIGDHFPPSDPQWRGAPSSVFLQKAAALVAARGARICNVDVTLICEQPKIKPHRQAMRERIAELLDVAVDQVSVKATTTEGMGFTGRGEGLAAQAMATVESPS